MAFDLEQFTLTLLAESLIYDPEYGAMGQVSLIDEVAGKEVFLASIDPDDGTYLLEEATEWEPDTDVDEDIGFALAVDGKPHTYFDTDLECAAGLMKLAQELDLAPSFLLLVEESG